MSDHDEAVRRSFDPRAEYYVQSAIHRSGPDLPWLIEESAAQPCDLALDVATGTGHAALTLAAHAHRVVALDLTPGMLEAARRLAAERGVANVVFAEGRAEALPFPDGLFDVVCCRIAAHHFGDPAAAIREMARVLAPGGRLALIDNVAPDDAELDRWINEFERFRDPSHVRAYTVPTLVAWLAAAGLRARVAHVWDSPMEVGRWAASAPDPAACGARLASAPEAVKRAFKVEWPHFCLIKAFLIARQDPAASGP